MVLLFASGNRDPARFADPDVQHFGFGGGLHYCVGAPLARVETEAALVALAPRLRAPRLLEDPPPYRNGASLRGPLRLDLAIEGISDRPVAQVLVELRRGLDDDVTNPVYRRQANLHLLGIRGDDDPFYLLDGPHT